ncbi:MAG: YlbF family regulator [Clostridiales bacterium]|nr:YlbF family regulator [Clostridiales bacterium]
MNNVMHKAQELAEAIVESSVYQRMHAAELQVNKDEASVKAVSDFVEKRQAVESILASNNMDHSALAEAGKAMEAAEKAMNEVPLIMEMQEARREFTQMMENVNRILRLVITGETEDECDCGDHHHHHGGCTGSCSTCGGCH